ncbi:outer membrane beta-barrel protein [Sphingomonas radiodurans]|uniref:outer membrane beta-barrel protein n=1 Tax=Sphingomonas radiodurans TaxID=2890321 RepID=UPI001E564262|nr:outer membrane beta-barrel protein [Sphingomonas radiodurans]WBH18088.1 outer membrane beta-barrel protein [Sphingomonas radiodurans]
MIASVSPARLLVTASALLLAAPAAAQLLQDVPTVVVPPEPPITTQRSVFARDAQVAVADRMLPAFSAEGVTVGAFDVYPGISIGGLYTSNVLANNARRRSDTALVVRPEVTVRTSAGPYQVTAFARGDFRQYVYHSSESTEEGLAGVQGSVAVGTLSRVTAGVSYGSLINPRFSADSPVDAAKPLEYTVLNAFAGGTIEQASTRVIVRADLSTVRFRDAPRVGGGTLFTRDRDRTRLGGLLRLERSISPALSVYGAATANRVDFRLPTLGTISRDSTGYGVYVGTSFEATRLVRGDIRVGYIRQTFNNGAFRPIQGLGALGTVTVFPNPLWTLTARVESTIEDSGVPGTGGVLRRGASLRADHELRRYLIATLEGGYNRDNYRGLTRRDDLPFAGARVTYLSRGHWNAQLGYRYLSRSCNCAPNVANFDDHRLMATLTLQK